MRDAALPSLAVGFFDGVHLGHRQILAHADTALTFRNHPLSVLCPERAPRLIMSFEERIEAIRACGVREVIALEFTRELAETEPAEFVRRNLHGHIFCGDNWRFGRGGRGDAAFLRAQGLEVTTVPYAVCEGKPISSTRIRETLESGEMELAAAMLGRPFTLEAVAASGKGEGRRLGFPTVNLLPRFLELQLRRGVYEVRLEGRTAIANFGLAPTFGERAWKTPVLEVHFLGEGIPEIGLQPVKVELKRFIRAERVFSTPEELKAQIVSDCAAVENFRRE